jgi:hypothetical protein
MSKLAFVTLVLLLAGCSASTRYTLNVSLITFVAPDQRILTITPGSGSLLFPGNRPEGLLVPLPSRLDILERGQALVVVTLTNTGNSEFSGTYELRLAPASDTNVNDNAGGDTGLGSDSFNVPVGSTQEVTINIAMSDAQHASALEIIRGGAFRVAIRIGASSSGGTLALNQGRVSVSGRPFAVIR